MTAPDLHPACAPIAALLGTWRGEGRGRYPTIADFTYGEELTFSHVGRPFLVYAQRTWSLETGAPMHSETGYWRSFDDGRVEVVLAHPFGVVEVSEGRLDGTRISLVATKLVSTSTAKRVDGLARTFDLSGDRLTYSLAMATAGQRSQDHVSAELKRV